ncbi:LacI family DNA-binding transcriptional regulator [Lutibacter sp. TH_r2]|uniref:LacI family DNA-binding transcriptional regulator n=1 Tax=Lutibacter sp. TH_r2 TaxID=3082083 RepID=UPI002952ABE5|nr:LacI family DNA-binding transcriptional regulator [Lutibacter sp. TH_r2]MDV7188558.1 LacI family DNA-binding transcriptional regulator [Lutibacter sp. TH_r2]
MRPKITLKTIAKEFEVSISTVSKALKNSNEIGEELREKIKAFADYYNYKPNSLALQLRNQKTSVIGVVIPEIVHHFFSTVIDGIEVRANEKGYNVMVCLSNESYEKEVTNLSLLTNGSVDGLIVSVARETQKKGDYNHFKALTKDGFPLVLFDRGTDSLECDQVIIDDIAGAYKAAKHLIEIGRRKIALLTTEDFISVGALRKIGFRKAMQDCGIDVNEDLVFKINDSKDLYEQIEQIFQQDEKPDAILAVNEIYAAIAMKIAQEHGYVLPDDIAVIGFTSGLISEFTTPSLTSVEQHGFLMGQQAAELLINRIEHKAPSKYIKEVISPTLKIRESTILE